MTKARRRVARLALQLHIACTEPVFAGSNYREQEAGLRQQWSALPPSRRKAARRQALRQISEAGGLERAVEQWVPGLRQQGSTGREPPVLPSLQQLPRWPPCPVCRMRFGRPKRSLPNQMAAQQLCAMQRDPGLVVYPCPAGAGYHLGHLPNTRPAMSSHPPTTAQQPEPHRVNAHVTSPMLPNPLHKESPMKMQATLGHPILIALYSAALLLIGCGLGVRFNHSLPTALWLCVAGGVVMAAHDLATGFLWFWLTATWVRSVTIQRDRRG